MSATESGRALRPKEHIKLTNQSLVFEAMGENEKLTITELTLRVNETKKSEHRISEQTVRRAIGDLVKSGLIRQYEKKLNAATYGKLSASMSADAKTQLIPFAGQMVSVEQFIREITEPNAQPFRLKVNVLSEAINHAVRRTMLHTILTADGTGSNADLHNHARRLHNVVAELEFALANLKTFIDSPVWYEQYRDRIGYAVRKLIENDPDLYQLAVDYMKSEMPK